ncbi:hypothetical protein SDC9_192779 [bioreactor metagenome]|uniref:Uncharacterized protein n=1 Tax=bioreactor metagenome TaxID=1076179 RepID=A0A645I359_9ZZZZ
MNFGYGDVIPHLDMSGGKNRTRSVIMGHRIMNSKNFFVAQEDLIHPFNQLFVGLSPKQGIQGFPNQLPGTFHDHAGDKQSNVAVNFDMAEVGKQEPGHDGGGDHDVSFGIQGRCLERRGVDFISYSMIETGDPDF